MSRRVLLTSALVALLLGLVVLAPGLPPVRGALLQRAATILASEGVALSYQDAAGNAWRRVQLLDATLEGHGATVTVDSLELAYHLPSLLGGELPLSVRASGVRGDFDLAGVEQLLADAVADGGGSSIGVRVVLQEVEFTDVVLSAENVPYTLPSITLSDIHVTPEPGALNWGARVSTEHGGVSARGRLTVPAYDLTGTITSGDVAVAQAWWPGAVDGSFVGEFSLRRGQFNADVTINDAVVEQSGFQVVNVRGAGAMRYPFITANLTGESFDGPVSASGTINITAKEYRLNGSAEPQLAGALEWLAQLTGSGELPIEASGGATVAATVTGWKTPTIEATATGAGAVAGLDLSDLNATLHMVTSGSIRAGFSALLGGGSVNGTIAPSALGNRLVVNSSGLDLTGLSVGGFSPGGTLEGLSAQVELAGTPVGTVRGAWVGELAGQTVRTDVDGRIDGDGLQAFFTASSPLSGSPATAPVTATGAVVFADGQLNAGATVADLQVPALDRPLRLGVTAQGALSDLALVATVENDAPVLLDLALLQAGGALAASDPVDVRGTASGRLRGGRIEELQGEFGPLSLRGSVALSPLEARSSLSVRPLAVRVGSGAEPALAAVLSVQDGSVTFTAGQLVVAAPVVVSGAEAGPVRLAVGTLPARFELTLPANDVAGAEPLPEPDEPAATWRFTAGTEGEPLRFAASSEGVPYELEVTALPVLWSASEEVVPDGGVTGGSATEGVATLTGTLRPGAAGTLNVEATLAPGSELAGLTLVNGVELSGTIDPTTQQLSAAGSLGRVPLRSTASWAGEAVTVVTVLSTAGDELTATLTPASGRLGLVGTAQAAPLLAELGLPTIDATLTGALSYTPAAGYAGSAAVSLLDPVPVEAALSGAGDRLDLAVSGHVAGVPLTGTGQVLGPPLEALAGTTGGAAQAEPRLLVNLGPLEDLVLDTTGVRGAGTVPAWQVGPAEVEPTPWALEFSWEDASGWFRTGGETLELELVDGAMTATGSLAAVLSYGGNRYRLSAWPGTAPGSTTVVADAESTQVGAALMPLSGGPALLTANGTLADLNVELAVELEELAAVLPAAYRPNARLEASATVNAVDGPTYSGRLRLTPTAPAAGAGSALNEAQGDLEATFGGVGASFDLALEGAGLQVDHRPAGPLTDGRLTLSAQSVDLAAFLPPDLNGVLNGTLSYGAAGWRGALTADLSVASSAPDEPLVAVAATLRGAFATLELDLTAVGPADAQLAASGTLLPEPRLSGDLRALGGQLEGQATFEEGALTATVSSREWRNGDALQLAPITAQLHYDPATGVLTLHEAPLAAGEPGADPSDDPGTGAPRSQRAVGLDLRLSGTELSGHFALPVTVTGVDLDLTGTVSGALTDPALSAVVRLADAPAGEPLASVNASLAQGATLVATLEASQAARFLPASAAGALGWLDGPATLLAAVLPSGSWAATAHAALGSQVAAAGEPLELGLVATGSLSSGVTYGGQLALNAEPQANANAAVLSTLRQAANTPFTDATPGTLQRELGWAPPIAAVAFEGVAGRASAELDLATVAWERLGSALGVPLEIQGTGLATLGTAPLNASLTLDMEGHLGDNVLRVSGSAPADLQLALAGPLGELTGSLAFAAGVTGGGTAHLTGHLADRPVELSLVIDEGLTSGDLSASAVGATLSARLTTEPSANAVAKRTVSVNLVAPPSSLIGPGVTAAGVIAVTGDQVHLSELAATLVGVLGAASDPDQSLELALRGPLYPATALTGTLRSPLLEDDVTLGVGPAEDAVTAETTTNVLNGLAATARWRDLAATGSMLAGGTVHLAGSATAADLTALAAAAQAIADPAADPNTAAAGPSSGATTSTTGVASLVTALAPQLTDLDVGWSATAGWSGRLTATTTGTSPWLPAGGDVQVRAEATEGALAVNAAVVGVNGADAPTAAEVNVLLPPRPFSGEAIAGTLTVDAPIGDLYPDLAVPLRLGAEGTIGGTLLAPTMVGTLRMDGAVTAVGEFAYVNSEGSLTATGPQLRLNASLGSQGAVAEAEVVALDLQAWLPQLPGGQLWLNARLADSQVSLERILVRGPNSLVSGNGTLFVAGPRAANGPTFSAALDANVNLADLTVGDVELIGTVRGPLVISSAPLSDLGSATVVANLAALNVGTPVLSWSASGNLTLGGTLADPAIAAQLSGDGDLRGLLTFTARPGRTEFALTSSLGFGDVSTDLRLDLAPGQTHAAGSVVVGDGVLLVSEGATAPATALDSLAPLANVEPGDMVVTGAGRFSGLAAVLASDLSRGALRADLASLTSGVSGLLSLAVGVSADPWLAGAVTGLEVGGYALEPLTIRSASPGAEVELTSPDLRAALDPLTLGWSLRADGYHLTGLGLDLTASADGVGASGSLTASVAGPQVDASLTLSHDATTTLQLTGTAYGGELELAGKRGANGEWSGAGSYQGDDVLGFAVQAEATLLGVDLVPLVVLTTRAENGVIIAGNASASLAGVSLDQFVWGAPLNGVARVEGRVLPGSDLTISTLDLPDGQGVSAAAAARASTSSVHLTSAPGAVADGAAALRATGRLDLTLGPAHLTLAGATTRPALTVEVAGLPALRAEAELAAPSLIDLVSQVIESGLTLEGREAVSGQLHLDVPGRQVLLRSVGLALSGVEVSAAGAVGLGGADVVGSVVVHTDLPVAERQTGYVFPWQLRSDGATWRLDSSGVHGELHGTYGASPDAGGLSLSADLQLADGHIAGQLGLVGGGLTGTLSVQAVRLLSPELGALSVDVEATVAEGRVGGSSTVSADSGRLVLSGSWGLGGLLPEALAPDAPSGGRLEARLRSLELSAVPYVRRYLPELYGEVIATAQLRDGFVFGQLVAEEIGVADISTPVQVNFSGRPTDLSFDVRLRGALGTVNLAAGSLNGMLRLERFPLNLLSTAVVGPSDFTADVTGVMRFDGPLSAPERGYLRLATEEVRLERMGVTTLGNVSVTIQDQALTVERAEFEGLGAWRAGGVLSRERFDLKLEADQADFTPLLGLVPQFARLGVGAEGSFDLEVLGSAANPSITLLSPELEVEVAGTRYRLEETQVELDGVTLSVLSTVHGLRPVGGTLNVTGGALLTLYPFSLGGTDLTLTGDMELASFGHLTAVQGALRQRPDGTPVVELIGTLGSRPLTVNGTLAPLDLRAVGTGVTARLPSLLVDRAVVDAQLNLVSEAGGVALSGSVVADEVVVDPAARSAVQAEAQAAGSENQAPPQAGSGRGLAGLRFADLAIRAPGRVGLTTSVGAFEAGLDLVLSGTGAEPRLSGTASAIRGNLRFAGRDFTIDRAVATFTPNRGVYPELDVAAHAEFDKQRVMSAVPNVSFAAPRDGNTFLVELAFFGPVEPTPGGGFRFDIQPVLVSNALIDVASQNGGAGVTRAFTDAELMALVTLGRFELNADIIGSGGLGEAVATGALDTAIDLLVVSGLEGALREALGIDVVEIRTTSLSSLLDEGGQPFGVSVRVGGYLQPELFASYRIGTYDGADPEFSITNEVLLRYALGPIDVDIIGRVDLPVAGTQGTARPEIGTFLGYQFSPWLGVEGGVTLGTTRSRIELGVTIRW